MCPPAHTERGPPHPPFRAGDRPALSAEAGSEGEWAIWLLWLIDVSIRFHIFILSEKDLICKALYVNDHVASFEV